jgi:hypothetical protein
VPGPFKFESKSYTVTVKGKSQFAAVEDTPRTRTIGPSSSAREKPVILKNRTLLFLVLAVFVVGVIAVVVVATTVVAVVLVTHKKKATS